VSVSTKSVRSATRLMWCLAISSAAAWSSDPTLVLAAKDQDAAGIRVLLKKHADVNARQGDGATALHWAAHWDDRQTADLLIHAGANANAADDEGVTPLSLACLNGSPAMVEMLLKAGANPNAALQNGETPLMTAAHTGNLEVLKLLLANKADVNAKEVSRGQTVLMRAVAENHTGVVKALVETGADVHARSGTGFTPLLFAAQQGNIETARILLDAGSNVNETAPDGIGGDTNARNLYKPNTEAGALLVAIDSNHEAMARFLVEHGADVNQNGTGRTPLHSAVQQAMPELATALLARGADPNARLEKAMPLLSRYIGQQAGVDTNPLGATPFWLAAEYGDARMMRILVAGGANPKLNSKDNTTALMAAAGVDFIEGQDRYGRRWFQPSTLPLQQAALEAVKLCLELGIDINAVNGNGQTAMHGAAYMGSNLIAQYLFEHGAKLDIQNKLGQTPYFITQGVYQAGSFIIRKETGDLLRTLGADTRLGAELGHDGAPNKQIAPAK
jgi:ankyrin repeat protein